MTAAVLFFVTAAMWAFAGEMTLWAVFFALGLLCVVADL